MNSAIAISERLTREVGILAGRLDAFLDSVLSAPDGPLSGVKSFLRSTYEAVSEGRPVSDWTGGPLDRRPEGSPHPLDRLASALSLSPEETDLLLLAGMPEEHEGLSALFRTLHPRGESRPSVGLAAQFLCRQQSDRDAFRAMLESGAATRSGALRLSGSSPYFERSLELTDSLWPVLHGLDSWPAGISLIRTPQTVIATAGLDDWFCGAARSALSALARGEACTVLVTAETEEIAFHRGLALVSRADLQPVGIALPARTEDELERLIQPHTLARGVVPVLCLPATDGPASPQVPYFAGYPNVIVVCGRTGSVHARRCRPIVTAAAERLDTAARQRIWSAAIPRLAADARGLAARFPAEPYLAAEVAADLGQIERLEARSISAADVAVCLRTRAGLSLAAGVKLVRPMAQWKDLVLKKDRTAQLEEAMNRLLLQARVLDEWGFLRGRFGARGVRMLFSGPPGTGKTLAAEVLAHSLSVELLLVDISRVVSKWIGETEKNLAAVFDAAESAQAVLFFDEADALFGKRTEVSDAHDRYANLETAYLLSRLERFEGLAILATNLRTNIDPAFLRRIEFSIDFEEPDREERVALWRCHVPPKAPLAPDVDFRDLAARYPVVGGLIRNAAVAAAFLAAGDGGLITRDHLVHALHREYEKAGRAFPEDARRAKT